MQQVKENKGAILNQTLNFKTISDKFTADDVLNAYFEGKDALWVEIKDDIMNGLQVSSISSNYLFEKLQNLEIPIKNMYLRILNINKFDSLVILEDSDYYNKDKRWEAYDVARKLNEGIDSLDINFSFMPYSEELDTDSVSSEGFIFRYDKKDK